MNIGPVNTSMPAAANSGAAVAGASVSETAAASDAGGGNVNIPNNNVAAEAEEPEVPGGAPSPLKQMSTSDFLGLREVTQTESVMDKLAKMFEAIVALRILQETVENINESLEQTPEGEK